MTLLDKLTALLDQPSINWKGIILGFTTFQFLFETFLTLRQYKVLQRDKVPKQLEQHIDDKIFKSSQEYSRAKAKFSIVNGTISYFQNFAIIKFDILPKLWSCAKCLYAAAAPYLPAAFQSSVIVHSLFFFFVFQIISTVFSLPINYYQTFVLEEKFGFNKSTPKLWIADTIKTLALSIAFGYPITAAFLKIIDYFGKSFTFYVWIFVVIVQIVGIAIYPTLIQPLFNKLTPLDEGELKTSIENLASKNKFPLSKLYVIDGSKRSGHSNAYFYGLPWSKQIVIYDTLISSSTTVETTAVLAHEIGHWALSHNIKTILIGQCHILAIFTLFSVFFHNKSLYHNFGFYDQYPVLIGYLLFNDILQPLDNIMTFFMHILSRKHEYEADEYAVKLGYSDSLSRALVNLNKDNLSAPDADWLYSSYHYSHPILAERLSAIEKKAQLYGAKEK